MMALPVSIRPGFAMVRKIVQMAPMNLRRDVRTLLVDLINSNAKIDNLVSRVYEYGIFIIVIYICVYICVF
jgi:hypothetical protein